MRTRSWTEEQLKMAVKESSSIRQVISRLGLIPAGGNYSQMSKYIKSSGLSTAHFTGMGWRAGLKVAVVPAQSLESIMVKSSTYQSFKLKKRLFAANLKSPKCELCGWAERSLDGRVPVELDHINGDHSDNRFENLRVLCPNCHSLQSTHRGRNTKRRRGGEIG